jgi:ABC-type glutathione transport system ATPase component
VRARTPCIAATTTTAPGHGGRPDAHRLWARVGDAGFTTALLVSHRSEVLERADRVVVLESGRVVESV